MGRSSGKFNVESFNYNAPDKSSLKETGLAKEQPASNSALIQELMEIRQRIVDSGRPLLSWDEIYEEVAKRRA